MRDSWGITVAAALATACGRIGFDALDDAAGPPLFGAPVKLVIDRPEMSDPVQTPDGLTMYLSFNADIYVTRRESLTAPWQPVTGVPSLMTADIDTVPALSADSATLWIAHSTPPASTDLSVTTWDGTTWSSPQPILELTGPGSDSPGSLFDGDLQLAYTSERSGRPELFLARRASPISSWDAPVPIEELNDGVGQNGPHVVGSGLRCYFAADRGQGHSDLYVAGRAGLDDRFGSPQPLVELNSPMRDDDVWLSPDERTVLFVSDRDGSPAIYMATRMD